MLSSVRTLFAFYLVSFSGLDTFSGFQLLRNELIPNLHIHFPPLLIWFVFQKVQFCKVNPKCFQSTLHLTPAKSNVQQFFVIFFHCFRCEVLPFLLRRLKTDVLKDLPPKTIQDFYVELSPIQVNRKSSVLSFNTHQNNFLN